MICIIVCGNAQVIYFHATEPGASAEKANTTVCDHSISATTLSVSHPLWVGSSSGWVEGHAVSGGGPAAMTVASLLGAAEARSQNYFNIVLSLKRPQLPQTSPMTLQLAMPIVLLQAFSRMTSGSSRADAVKVR